MSIAKPEGRPGSVVFPASDQFPLGRAYGRVDSTGEPASTARPFGLTLGVRPKRVDRLNLAELSYDEEAQVGLLRHGGELVRLGRHTDGQTNTQTNSDGHQGYDSDTDHRED
ncbi:putative ATP-grasp target RiPP [Tamaricihabitans halophyticus]|uniref:Putative ATP-grasp target RiPP n=1 Tax=Tamaricihabitans halophyticus TaxID=1262583 RepID=A0A4R2R2R3_9PSEU|nr:putative ATP-grasp-modified RiPP [Tamaricihabitans halophyticus]TCP57052.1 putative ATP-grasp target RiPP [Tamaricihabitans halophyticus]